jgi:hypothetical protein
MRDVQRVMTALIIVFRDSAMLARLPNLDWAWAVTALRAEHHAHAGPGSRGRVIESTDFLGSAA